MVNTKPVKLGKNIRQSFAHIDEVAEMPNLIEVQKNSYQWFLDEGLRAVFKDISSMYDKNVKRMASMHICLHTSLHGYFFIKLQLHFHTTMNQYVNKSIRQRIIEASKKRPFSTKGISPSIELQDNVCFLFCSVQSLDDGITKLCRTIRV